MAVLGEEVADLYISVHADTTDFKKDMARLKASTAKLSDEMGEEAGRRFQQAWTKEIRNISLQGLARDLRARLARIQRTLSTDFRIIGAIIQDQLIRPINRGLTRAVNQVIVSVGRAKDAMVDFGQDTLAVFRGQLGDQLLRVRHLIDQITPSLRGMANGFLNTATNMREMLAPGLWDRFLDRLQLFVVHMSVSGRRAVEEFRKGFDRAWNSDLMVATRAWVRDLSDAITSGLRVLFTDMRTWFRLGFQMSGDEVVSGTRRITASFRSMWTRITTSSERDSRAGERAVEEFAEDTANAFEKMADASATHTREASRNTTRFVGRLKGSRNDALNAIGAIGGAFESLVSKTITGGFKLLGGALEKVGGSLLNVGEGAGFLQGPANLLGAWLVRAGAGMSLASASGIGLVIVIATLVASFGALGAAAAILSALLSALTGIVVALASSLAFAVAGALLPLGVFALAAAAGVGALAAAFIDLSDEQKKAFDPLKDTVKEIQKVVREHLFKNLADQIDGLNGILKNSVAPLLIGAADSLSGVIDYMIMAFERPAVKAALDTLSQTLPGVLTDLGTAFVDFTTGALEFFSAIAPDVAAIAQDIADAAWEFSQWAGSVEGQTAIKEFFSKARESADILWGVIVNVGTALGTLFEEGKDGGDDLITKIGEVIGKFAEWASSDEGREQIKTWFDDAVRIAGDLWAAIQTVGDTIADLDTEENRQALSTLIGWITTALGYVNTLSTLFANLPGLIEKAKSIAFAIPGLGAAVSAAEALVTALKWIIDHAAKASGARQLVDNRGAGGAGTGPMAQKAGGILNSPTRILAGEAGREMIVPLVRPLNQVDPSVRAVSAFARGLDTSAFNSGNRAGKVINIHSGAVQVTAPNADEGQVANAVLDRLVARWK